MTSNRWAMLKPDSIFMYESVFPSEYSAFKCADDTSRCFPNCSSEES